MGKALPHQKNTRIHHNLLISDQPQSCTFDLCPLLLLVCDIALTYPKCNAHDLLVFLIGGPKEDTLTMSSIVIHRHPSHQTTQNLSKTYFHNELKLELRIIVPSTQSTTHQPTCERIRRLARKQAGRSALVTTSMFKVSFSTSQGFQFLGLKKNHE